MALLSMRRARTRAYAEFGVSTSFLPLTNAPVLPRFRRSAAKATMVSQSHLLNHDRRNQDRILRMISPTTTIATLWGIWLLGWLISAGATARTAVEQSVSSRLSHSLFIWVGALLLFFRPSGLDGLMRPLLHMAWVSWAGIGLVAIGLGFAGWARFHLGRFWRGLVR